MPAKPLARSHLRHPFTNLLGSAGHVRLLRVMAAMQTPGAAPELARQAGLTPQGARLALDTLTRQHLVRADGSGRSRLYSMDRSHPLAGAVSALFEAEHRRWESLLQSLRSAVGRHGPDVMAAWLYGSVARGEDRVDSDLDLAIITPRPDLADRLREALMPIEDAQRIRVSLTALSPQDLAALGEDDPWWRDVIRDARVLKGPPPEQARRRLT